ncbi:MAG: hypothetical protein A2Y84_00260 [Candidatus Colwellbacteria bacterium RBG_13_48_8]|uniref:Homing endonuclease LAGLIDADG domain-containing protein n=1 Tax=Candidatus Colwellbacteria bacterium RBG_13_48_8 TaxID=1797685 RepID=A0A1G1YXV1_9BACT|nr:MAG: hypothetical protein A2Y84_00260 [Candidatus Colwellbacteria bacterium RBG_13_48_8]
MDRNLSKNYIIGLVESRGSFSFSTQNSRKRRVPSFRIKLHVQDLALIEAIKEALGLDNKIYVYSPKSRDGAKRHPYAMLIVRDVDGLKNKVIPFFYGNFRGRKAFQFNDWLERIGKDPWVSDEFKVIHRLYKSKYYKKRE